VCLGARVLIYYLTGTVIIVYCGVDREVVAIAKICPCLGRHTLLFRPDAEKEAIRFLTENQ
jgi:hypothetical protein